MTDKLTRIASFVRKGFNEVKDETIEDTLPDLANYSLLCLIEFRKETNVKNSPTNKNS